MEFMNSGKKYSGHREKYSGHREKYSGHREMPSRKTSHDGRLQGREKVMFFHVLTWGNRWRCPGSQRRDPEKRRTDG